LILALARDIAEPTSFHQTGFPMAAYQFVYHMSGVSKTYPGGKKTFENIHLNFFPGVKIGVVGVNGAGKSTLLKIMAGLDKDFTGEAWAAEGAKVGYLPQEPKLDPTLTVRENVMLGVAEKKAILDRYNELAMNYSDETADEMAALQDDIDAQNLWDLDSQIDVSMEALPTFRLFPVVRRAVLRCANCFSKHRTCCSSTSQPTTSTLKQSHGCSSTSLITKAQS
jgi:hypothetical protein